MPPGRAVEPRPAATPDPPAVPRVRERGTDIVRGRSVYGRRALRKSKGGSRAGRARSERARSRRRCARGCAVRERRAKSRRDELVGRHRRTAQRRQVHALQRAVLEAGRGRELPVLHHRPQRRRGARCPDPRFDALVQAVRAREPGAGHGRLRRHRRPGARRQPRARARATRSCRTSATATRSPTWCAASRTRTSCTSTAGSTRPPTSRRSTPS